MWAAPGGTREQMPGEVDSPSEDYEPLSRQLLLDRGVGGRCVGRGRRSGCGPWRRALFHGGGRAADPQCLGPACEDCVFNLERLARKWVDSLCELCVQPAAERSAFSCISWSMSAAAEWF